MTQLKEFNSAVRLREVIKAIIKDELDNLRPRARYAEVVAVTGSGANRQVELQFPGETETFVIVNPGSIVPTTPGQTVRVGGTKSDRYIETVLGSEVISSDVFELLDANGSGDVAAQWRIVEDVRPGSDGAGLVFNMPANVDLPTDDKLGLAVVDTFSATPVRWITLLGPRIVVNSSISGLPFDVRPGLAFGAIMPNTPTQSAATVAAIRAGQSGDSPSLVAEYDYDDATTEGFDEALGRVRIYTGADSDFGATDTAVCEVQHETDSGTIARVHAALEARLGSVSNQFRVEHDASTDMRAEVSLNDGNTEIVLTDDGAGAESATVKRGGTANEIATAETASWTPTFSGLTIGNGTLTSRCVKVSAPGLGIAICEFAFTLGSTSAITGDVSVTNLPFGPDQSTYQATVHYVDSGTATHVGVAAGGLLRRQVVSGTNIIVGVLSSTAPFTWVTGDIIQARLVFIDNA